MLDARRVLQKHKPVAAFGVGGYAAGPMMLATWFSGVPNVIFEPNAEPGLTNKVLAKLSKRIATGYEISAHTWGKKAVVTGCPVRPEFFSIASRRLEKPFRLASNRRKPGRAPHQPHVRRRHGPPCRAEKMSSPSCIKPANAIIMPCAPPTRGAKSTRRSSPSLRIWRNALPGQM